MSLTRRSFVKKSSYSAVAVTVLGTGAGLAQGQSTIALYQLWEYQTTGLWEGLSIPGPRGLTDAQAIASIQTSSEGKTAMINTITQSGGPSGPMVYGPGKPVSVRFEFDGFNGGAEVWDKYDTVEGDPPVEITIYKISFAVGATLFGRYIYGE